MTLHTQTFALGAFVLSVPAVTLLAQVAINPELSIDPYTGLLFTWSALASVCCYGATVVCAILDRFTA